MADEAQAQGPKKKAPPPTQKKMNPAVGLLGTGVAIVLDIIGEVPLAGDVEAVPTVAVMIIEIATAKMEKSVLIAQGVAIGLRLIPVVQEIPALYTLAWLYTWYSTNHPNALTKKINKGAEELASAEKGGAGEAEAAVGTGEVVGGAGAGAEAGAGAAALEAGEAVAAPEVTALSAAGEAAAKSAERGSTMGPPQVPDLGTQTSEDEEEESEEEQRRMRSALGEPEETEEELERLTTEPVIEDPSAKAGQNDDAGNNNGPSRPRPPRGHRGTQKGERLPEDR